MRLLLHTMWLLNNGIDGSLFLVGVVSLLLQILFVIFTEMIQYSAEKYTDGSSSCVFPPAAGAEGTGPPLWYKRYTERKTMIIIKLCKHKIYVFLIHIQLNFSQGQLTYHLLQELSPTNSDSLESPVFGKRCVYGCKV